MKDLDIVTKELNFENTEEENTYKAELDRIDILKFAYKCTKGVDKKESKQLLANYKKAKTQLRKKWRFCDLGGAGVLVTLVK